MPTTSIDAVTLSSLRLALDAASLRQEVIAANIANTNVTDYATQGVSFGAIYAATSASSTTPRLQAHVAPILDDQGRPHTVQVDAEMAKQSLNELHYQALVKGLNEQLSILSLAVSDGQR